MLSRIGPLAVFSTVCLMCSCTNTGRSGVVGHPSVPTEPHAVYREIRDAHVAQWEDLERRWRLAWWEAALSGNESDFERAQDLELAVRRLHSNRETFAKLQELRTSGTITDPASARSLELLYWAFAENQLDDDLMQRMVALQTGLEQTFNTFRPQVEGQEVTANDIREVLSSSTDSERRRAMWEASKEVGPLIAPRLIELAKLRNEAAAALGYDSYYNMMLRFREQDPEEIRRVFDELAQLTDEPFRRAKAEIDERLAARYGLSVDQLQPWHYGDPFFQESPGAGINLDRYFASQDRNHLVTLAISFFDGIGLPVVRDILQRSDLYERDGKVEHAFCTDIDRLGDVRILTNLRNDERWMSTLMHELGHGVYDASIDRALPFELRQAAHTFTTEGVAELFGHLPRDQRWLRDNLQLPADVPENFDSLVAHEHRVGLLVFARWSLVMATFEREFYANPDQDLNELWWSIVERFQGIRRPGPRAGGADFATKIHLVVAPVYYHNYMLGRMYAAQLRRHLARAVSDAVQQGNLSFQNHPALGRYLTEHVFRPGALYPWAEFVRRSTGEPLTASAFAEAIQPPAPPPEPVLPAGEEATAADPSSVRP